MMTSYTPEPSRRSAPASPAQTLLRYAREGGIVLRGPYSGQIYRFSRDAATPVLAEDVGALLRTGNLEYANR
ncbi:MAG: hypothetical protein ACJ76Y_24725 [Thermoanaerobaculia bacterium]